MHPLVYALLTAWDWRPEILVPVLTTGLLFTVGWVRLRRRSQQRLATVLRLLSFWSGLLILILSLMSGVDTLGGQLFFIHMIQHILLVMVVPPLIFLANPFPFLLWGLSRGQRQWLASYLTRESGFRRGLATATHLGIVWFVFVVILVAWHDPAAYNLALAVDWVHDLEHLTFYLSAMLFWWQITAAGPRIHKQNSPVLRMIFLGLAIPPNVAIGALLSFTGTPVYAHYTEMPRIWGISVLLDQQIAGIIMWIPTSMMYLIGILVLLAGVLGREEGRPLPPVEGWSTEKAMIAPGLDHRVGQSGWPPGEQPRGSGNAPSA